MKLSEANRKRTVRLAALLRVADALDRTHLQQVEKVECVVKPKDVRLVLDCKGDCILERWAMDQKKSLFEKAFGRTILTTS
jgi:exopolyphosphatase/guanosine-5'-triphosphate,3'-diphosphate pyrophosphatase